MKSGDYNNQIFRQLQEVMKKCDDLSLEIKNTKIEAKQRELKLEKEFKEKEEKLNKRIKKLETEVLDLKKENKILRNDNDRMKNIIGKNSTNSSIPPSRDEKPKKRNINLREKTNKKSGGQKGHKGVTFTKKDVEELLKKDNVIKETIHHGNIDSKKSVTKYEIDIKTIVVVREHKFYFDKRSDIKLPQEYISDVHYGEGFKTLCNIMIVEEVISLERIKQFVEILTGGLLRVSEGSLVNWLNEKSRECKKVLKELKRKLKTEKMLYTDMTETRLNAKKAYVRNYSTEKLTLYIPSKDKKIHRVKRQWLLKDYTGYIVQDHDTTLYNFGLIDKHVECNVHLRRYLKNNSELTKHKWSGEMDKLLLEIKKEKEKYIEQGKNEFENEKLEKYTKEYDEIVENGYQENKESNSKYLKKDELAILNRLKKYKRNHLLYANNFEVPFDNNLSERDLRPIKTKKKVSGCHRNYKGLQAYCNIRSIISCCKKQGINYFNELVNIGKGNLVTIF